MSPSPCEIDMTESIIIRWGLKKVPQYLGYDTGGQICAPSNVERNYS